VGAAGTDEANDTTDTIDRLFAVRPADFVAERNAVAKALKAAGKREEGARALKLPRPTPSVWAVNQLARHVPALVRRLVEATVRLQAGGDGSYADALAAHRDVLKALRAKAEEILEASELHATLEVLARVVHDLRSGVLVPELRPSIESGRLERDVADENTANPFEQELPFPVPAASKAAPAPDTERAQREATRALEEARVAKLRRCKQLREEVAAAEAAVARAEQQSQAARRSLQEAERVLAASRTALSQASAALKAAESS
jgi:hypothetical protein